MDLENYPQAGVKTSKEGAAPSLISNHPLVWGQHLMMPRRTLGYTLAPGRYDRGDGGVGSREETGRHL